jgi:hypothetical protein
MRDVPMVLWVALGLVVAVTTGCTKTLLFSTATKVGLDISQRADQMIDVSFGYDRVELASIPAPKEEDAANGKEAYSVLGVFSVSYGNPFALQDRQPLKIDQFFATGEAALTAARSPGIADLFGRRTRQILEKKDQPARAGAGGAR